MISTNALPPEEEKKRAVGATVSGPSALFLQGLATAAGAWTIRMGRWSTGWADEQMLASGGGFDLADDLLDAAAPGSRRLN